MSSKTTTNSPASMPKVLVRQTADGNPGGVRTIVDQRAVPNDQGETARKNRTMTVVENPESEAQAIETIEPAATTVSPDGTNLLYAQATSTEPAAMSTAAGGGTASSATVTTTTTATTSSAAAAGFSGTTLAAIGGAIGVGAAAGGGGGGGKSTGDAAAVTPGTSTGPSESAPGSPPVSPPATVVPQPPAAPSIQAVAADNRVDATERAVGVTVSGTGVAGSIANISWGSITKTTTVDANGRWNVSFSAMELPAAQGPSTISATVTQGGLTSAAVERQVTIDTIPLAPTIQTVAGDNRVDSIELVPGVSVAGQGQAGATLSINWSGTNKTTTVDSLGQWGVSFSPAEVPTSQGSSNIEAKVTSFGLSSNAATRVVTIDTLPLAPVINDVSADNRINASELAAGVAVSGTSQANASVTVNWGSTSKVVTATGAGTWTTTFSASEVPAGEGNSSLTASATSSGLMGPSASRSVTVDTVAPSAPSATINSKGIVSGTAEAGATVVIDSNGDTLADATTKADNTGSYVFTTSFTGGQTLTIQTLDAAGNKSAGVSQVAPNSTYGSAGADVMAGAAGADLLIGGGGADTLLGGAGADQLIGGSSASVRNYQFEYWDLRGANAAGLWDSGSGGYYAIINATSSDPDMAGWKIGSWMDIQSREFGQGASKVVQWVGLPDLLATPTVDEHVPPVMEFRSTTANTVNDIPDAAPGSGRYLFDTVYAPLQGGSNIHQSIQTNPNEIYSLTMRVSDPSLSNNSMVVTWNGAELAVYDAIADTWSGSAPTITASGTNYVNLTWSVTPNSTTAATALDIKVYGTLEENPTNWRSMRIERVTLDANSSDGNDLLVGGSGNDRLFGQAGDDTLVGGTYDASTQTAAADGDWDHFIYSMRTQSGNDVIRGFEVGVDGLILTDLVDSHLGSGAWDNVTNPDASRTLEGLAPAPGGGYVQPAGTTNLADHNLSFHDLVQANSAHQYIGVSSDGTAANNLRITLHGVNGATLGSIVLEGVQFGTGAGQYDTVQDLLGDGYTDPTIATPVGSPTQLLWLTMDGYHANLLF